MERMGLYGYVAGMASAVILQPLDNIKMVLMMPPKDLQFTNNFIKNAQLSAKYLANDQGLKSFYRGLQPNIVKNGCGSAVYFFSLRFSQKINKKYQISNQNSFITNFCLSSFGRVISSIASNPFNILETRYQMAGKQRWSGSLIKSLRRLYLIEGSKGCFKGCLVNCYKQGIFAGLFYGMYQQCKKLGINSLISGMTSGIIATLISHPLQIVRTQLQASNVYVSPHGEWLRMSIKQQLVQLAKEGELLKGVSPRLIKKPLANTISFLLFQAMEKRPYQ